MLQQVHISLVCETHISRRLHLLVHSFCFLGRHSDGFERGSKLDVNRAEKFRRRMHCKNSIDFDTVLKVYTKNTEFTLYTIYNSI